MLPELAADFNVDVNRMALFQAAVMFPGIVTAVLMTKLLSIFGLRLTLAGALAIYGGAGVAVVAVVSYEAALLLRLLQGVGSGGLVATAFVLLRQLPEGQRGRAISINASIMSFMMLVQPLLGSALGVMSPRAPFLFYALSLALSAATLIIIRSGSDLRPRRIAKRRFAKGLAFIMAMSLTLNVLFFGWLLYLTPIILEHFGWGLGVRGIVLAVQSGLATVVTIATSSLLQTRRYYLLLTAGWSAFGISMGVLALTPTSLNVVILLSLAGTFYGTVNPVLVTLAAQGKAVSDLGWWQSSNRTGQVMGPLIVAGAWALMPLLGVLVLGAGIAMIGGLLSWKYRRTTLPEPD